MTPKRLIFAGTPDFSVPCLQALLDSKHDVCAVYTQPDRKAGRGQKLQVSPVKALATTYEVPVYQPKTLKTAEAQAELQQLQADLMVVVAYGLILPQAVLDSPHLGCVNVHASLLPRWRGAAPIQRALLAGDEMTGITLMHMDAGLDTGGMLAKATTEILPTDNARTLHDRLAQLGADLLSTHIDAIEHLKPEAQDDSLATYAHKLEKSEAQLDWQSSAIELVRKIKAFNPWPVAQATLFDQIVRIWEASAEMTEVATGKVGHVFTQDGKLDVMTGEGMLRITRLQKSGGKIISAKDFINGLR